MENEEQDRIRKEYYKSLCDNNAPPNGDGIKSKHSYFLRAKAAAPRYMGFQVSDDEDGRASSSICKSFLSSQVGPRKWDVEYCSEEEDLANCLVMLSNNNKSSDHKDKEIVVMEKGMFQCKACKKVFNSHQALGGHRASHKKVKGCFASKLDDGLNDDDEDEEENNNNGSKEEEEEQISLMPTDQFDAEMTTKKRVKMHECSVCRRVFSSGQALGGHKRCHWLTTSTDNAAAAFIPNFQYHHTQQFCEKPMLTTSNHHEDRQLDLNLNLPPPPHQDHDIKSNKYEASTRLCLQQYKNEKEEDIIDKNGMKLRKLSDLRDVNMDGGWLQMGIASNTTEMT